MTAEQIAGAYHGLTTGDQDPPRPWAHLSHVGEITAVSDLIWLAVTGFTDQAGFDMTVDGVRYQVMVKRLA